MKNLLTTLAVLAGIILLLLIFFNWDKIKNFFSPQAAPAPSPAQPTAYEKCLEANKQKADGETCTICYPSNANVRASSGVIQNGVCVAVQTNQNPPSTIKIKVTNPSGAKIYELQGTNFVAKVNAPVLPQNSEIVAMAVITSPSTYYQIAQNEWLHANDVQQAV